MLEDNALARTEISFRAMPANHSGMSRQLIYPTPFKRWNCPHPNSGEQDKLEIKHRTFKTEKYCVTKTDPWFPVWIVEPRKHTGLNSPY
jgi:hypothetical protein